MRKLPAAAIPVGAKVMVPMGKEDIQITISEIANGEPRPGQITWWDEASYDYVVPASFPVEVVKLP